ncbi:MAG: hypothetical protein AB7N65_14780 [Vicinamibacterales bacterium]
MNAPVSSAGHRTGADVTLPSRARARPSWPVIAMFSGSLTLYPQPEITAAWAVT